MQIIYSETKNRINSFELAFLYLTNSSLNFGNQIIFFKFDNHQYFIFVLLSITDFSQQLNLYIKTNVMNFLDQERSENNVVHLEIKLPKNLNK